MSRRSFAIAVLVVAASAHAQEDDRAARARDLYERGAALYAKKDYEPAIDAFKSAFALTGKANLLFNIAVAYEEWSGHCRDARDFYVRYLKLRPDAKDRPDVDARLQRLDQVCPETKTEPLIVPTATATAPSPPPPPPHVEPQRARHLNVAPFVLGGVSLVVGGGGGAALLGATSVKYDELKRTCGTTGCAPSTYRDWQTIAGLSYALVAAGAAGLAVSLVWLAAAPVHVTIVPSTTGAVAFIGRTF